MKTKIKIFDRHMWLDLDSMDFSVWGILKKTLPIKLTKFFDKKYKQIICVNFECLNQIMPYCVPNDGLTKKRRGLVQEK